MIPFIINLPVFFIIEKFRQANKKADLLFCLTNSFKTSRLFNSQCYTTKRQHSLTFELLEPPLIYYQNWRLLLLANIL